MHAEEHEWTPRGIAATNIYSGSPAYINHGTHRTHGRKPVVLLSVSLCEPEDELTRRHRDAEKLRVCSSVLGVFRGEKRNAKEGKHMTTRPRGPTTAHRVLATVVMTLAWLLLCGSAGAVWVMFTTSPSGQPWEDRDRLILVEAGQPIVLPIWAWCGPDPFCRSGCHKCEHGFRTRQWTITASGEGQYQILRSEEPGQSCSMREVRFSGVGEFTIQCTMGELPQLECEGFAQHQGDHSGATGQTQITLWYLEDPLTVDVSNPIRGEEVTTTAVVKGGVQVISYDWTADLTSWDPEEWGEPPTPSQSGAAASWAGRIVTDTRVQCVAHVRNPYDPEEEAADVVTATVAVTPRTWAMEPPAYSDGVYFVWQNHGYGFPENVTRDPNHPEWRFIAYARNTNAQEEYRDEDRKYYREFFTPIYGPGNNEFGGVTVSSGPNTGVWYNTNDRLYKVDRIGIFNYWVRPSAPKPSTEYVCTPPGAPNWVNWYLLNVEKAIAVGGNDDCRCGTPSVHGRWTSLKNHEGFGTRHDGAPDALLGHQSRAVKFLSESPQFDAVRRCEAHVRAGVDELRDANEGVRRDSSDRVFGYSAELHGYLNENDPQKHNGYRVYWYHRNQGEPGQWWWTCNLVCQ